MKKKGLNDKFVIAVGASAGGMEAIHEMFDNMHGMTGFSFVIVQHLSPDHKSLMGELLSRHTSMKVIEAENNMEIQPNCIYLIPNKCTMTVSRRKLMLHDKLKGHSPNNAIDIFFESLAKDQKEFAVGIILSGTGTDGTRGIEAIKNNGGVIVVQDPISAKFDGMPNSAIATGYADLILAPEMIPDELIDYLEEAPLVKSFYDQSQKEEYVVNGILDIIKTVTDYDFREYKRPTIYRRLAKRMAEKNIRSLTDYHSQLSNDQEEVKNLSKEFLINVTKFFRDTDAFEQIKKTVLPDLFKQHEVNKSLKVWVVACSTGEEAYSFAILFQEYMEANNIQDANIKIFATDIDNEALETASRALYPETISNDVPAELLAKYFIRDGKYFKVAPAIRKMIVFAHHDILHDPPFSKIDLVSCRNMLIYMNSGLQKNVLKTLHFALSLDGYLFLGSSENIGILKDAVIEVDRKWKLFRCMLKSSTHGSYTALINSMEPSGLKKAPVAAKLKNGLNAVAEIFKETLLEEQNYAGLLIDKEFDIKQATGNFKNFLNFPDGKFNFSLLKLVHPDLSAHLSIAIRKAIKDNKRVVINNIKVTDAGKPRCIDVIVKPYLTQKEYLQPFLFIILHEQKLMVKEPRSLSSRAGVADAEKYLELEKELNETRENMQALVEEIESANEELQTSNEEILSSNEELQSTNEELQSLNEELHTVNAEHQLKIKELIELNDDLNNYFMNSDIGQVIIDKKLVIRKFSPAATRQINLIPGDIGRSIIDISNNFRHLDFINSIKDVLQSGVPVEQEVEMGNETIYLMKLNPYLRLDKTIDGVVISFVDITETKKLTSLLTAVFNSSTSGISAKTAVRDEQNNIVDFEYLMSNIAAETIMGRDSKSIIGKPMRQEFPTMNEEYFNKYKAVVETGVPAQFEFYSILNDRWYDIVCVKMMDGIVTTYADITDKKQSADLLAKGYEDLKNTSHQLQMTNEQLELSNMDLYQFASIASHDLKEPLRKIQAFGNLLENKIRGKINEQEKNYLDKIIRSSSRMHNLIDDVLTFSRLSNTEIALEKTDLTRVVKNVLDDLEISIKTKGAKIEIEDLVEINAVPPQMHQLFHNLISNALKFNESKPARIEIKNEKVSSKIAQELGIDATDYNAVSVKDNGIGFENEFRDKIFKMFQRLYTSDYPGTGIGLAICKKIIENHGGLIFAESELEKGSKFTLLFPKHAAQARKNGNSVDAISQYN